MKTQLIYLNDSYQKEMDATILEVIPDGEGKFKVLLDKTVFYAMGGGQSTDQGTLTSSVWNGDVYQVMIKDGELWHYVKAQIAPIVGDIIHGVINWERRYKHMRYHSAGHIIDFALYLLGYSPKNLTPIKADHGKKPFIHYQGVVEENFKEKLQEKVDELISKNLNFSWEFQTLEMLQKEAIYLQPNLPSNKPLRTVRLESVGAVADGGTQIHTTGEAGKVIVETITQQDNSTIIFYSLPS
ncbi:MAG: alanyl-tRNA editing protein [Candidatus Roizmanbacteria bacterium]